MLVHLYRRHRTVPAQPGTTAVHYTATAVKRHINKSKRVSQGYVVIAAELVGIVEVAECQGLVVMG